MPSTFGTNTSTSESAFSFSTSQGQRLGTDWLTVIYRYFGENPDEGSDFISKGFVASAIFILYTRKINPIFQTFRIRSSTSTSPHSI